MAKAAAPAAWSLGTLVQALVYGLVNALMCVPCMYGYASVIFGADAYQPFMPALAKLVLLSCVVHQICFTLASKMPFAVGQVQDAGLIFLAHMTSNVAKWAQAKGDVEATSIAATAVACTAIATCLLGMAVLLFGKLRWARFVSYLPVPVIGGYLSFIGFFCIEAGLGLCLNTVINGPGTWHKLFTPMAATLCAPGLVAGLLFMAVGRLVNHAAALPTAMCVVPMVFYIVVYASGNDLDGARSFGWVGPATAPAEPAAVVELFDFTQVEWSLLPGEFPVWLGMVFVVSFSSCLDVAAIEMDMGKPLDTDAELRMIGWSNILSGATGGFTGSYIFSQTIFTYRTKVHSRLVGVVVILAEIFVFVAPVDPLQFVPLFYFAATLIFVGFELMYEWLFEVKEKLAPTEYFVLVTTFVAIQAVGINGGMLIGISCACLQFMAAYHEATEPVLVERRSRVVRSREVRQRLNSELERGRILTVELSGTLFFGSSAKLLEDLVRLLDRSLEPEHNRPKRRYSRTQSVRLSMTDSPAIAATPGRRHALLSAAHLSPMPSFPSSREDLRALNGSDGGIRSDEDRFETQSDNGTDTLGSGGSRPMNVSRDPGAASDVERGGGFRGPASAPDAGSGMLDVRVSSLLPSAQLGANGFLTGERAPSRRDSDASTFADETQSLLGSNFGSPGPGYGAGDSGLDLERSEARRRRQRPRRMLLLDMAQVASIDASAARNCFSMLRGHCLTRRAGLVYARCNRRVAMQLRVHGCLDGIKPSEEAESRGRWIGVRHFASMEEALDFCETTLLGEAGVAAPATAGSPHDTREDAVADVVYTILEGGGLPQSANPAAPERPLLPDLSLCKLRVLDEVATLRDYAAEETIFAAGVTATRFFVLLAGVVELRAGPSRSEALDLGSGSARLYRGSVFGFVDFQLAQARRFAGVAMGPTRVAAFSAADLSYLVERDPLAAWALNSAVLYCSAVELSNTREP